MSGYLEIGQVSSKFKLVFKFGITKFIESFIQLSVEVSMILSIICVNKIL